MSDIECLRVSQDACLVHILGFQAKYVTSYVGKSSFLEFWDKIAKMTLKIQANDLHFQFSRPAESIPWCMFCLMMVI